MKLWPPTALQTFFRFCLWSKNFNINILAYNKTTGYEISFKNILILLKFSDLLLVTCKYYYFPKYQGTRFKMPLIDDKIERY
jgi:hypothetical protein